MDSSVWGPAMWRTVHTLALAYEPAKAERYRAFFVALVGVIPCDACVKSFVRLLLPDGAPLVDERDEMRGVDDPEDLDAALLLRRTPDAFFAWTVALHNRVSADVAASRRPPHAATAWTPERARAELTKQKSESSSAPPSLIGPNALAMCFAVGLLAAMVAAMAACLAFYLLRRGATWVWRG